MNRYERIVLEAEKGIVFDISKETSGKLIIKALKIEESNMYFPKYAKPPIPEGYKNICGEWNNGFVIERYSDGSQFVWIPVESLNSNGTLNGVLFTEKFGRRNYLNKDFSKDGFNEIFTDELAVQYMSVKKYGGFYISRYNISKNEKTGEPQSVKGEKPWTNISFYNAKEIAAIFEKGDTITSHLVFGAEYDSVLEWLIESGAITYIEATNCSTQFGNYWDTNNSPEKIVRTGSSEKWFINNIYDFGGNVYEWTQEQQASSSYVVRSGDFFSKGKNFPFAARFSQGSDTSYFNIGFRIALYIDIE